MRVGTIGRAKRALLFGFALVGAGFSPSAKALRTDLDFFYLSDQLTGSNTGANSRLIWDFTLTLDLTKKGDIVAGWNYGSFSATDTIQGTTNTLTISDMGPVFGYYFDKAAVWSVYLTYNLISTGTFDDGTGVAVEWRGSTIKAEFGFNPEITSNLFLSFKLVYYLASFNEEITSGSSLTKTANGRTMIYPTIGLNFKWN